MLIMATIGRKLLCSFSTAISQMPCGLMRSLHTSLRVKGNSRTVTMIPGDGVGPELMASVRDVFSAAGVKVNFEVVSASEMSTSHKVDLDTVIESCRRNKVVLKGIIASPLSSADGNHATLNMRIRKSLDLYANVVPIKSMEGITVRHKDVDFIIIRESIEGEYSSLEHESVPGVVECLKIITRANSMRIAKFAFEYALKNERKKVTCIHKANIMKLSDGLFLECCKKVSKLYPTIKFESMIVDNCCMQLVSNPRQFDVMVMPNLYGNIVGNLGAGLVGGAGIVAGESHSTDVAVFEPGARQAFVDKAGKNEANPTAILLCAANMLTHLDMGKKAVAIRTAVVETIKKKKTHTRDLGGVGTRSDFTKAVIKNLKM